MKKGVIYILTNPSFPEYVKIGYALDVEKRLQQLNRSECIPFAFRVYALYEVDHPLQDKQLHKLIDTLNPDLRAIDVFNGKERIREFYAMSPEDAFTLLKCRATISGTLSNLKRTTPTGQEKADEDTARKIELDNLERREPFKFSKCGIPVGAEISMLSHPEIKATVVDDRTICCDGELTSLSGKAKEVLQTQYPVQGTIHWTYNGQVLNDLRLQLEKQGKYESV